MSIVQLFTAAAPRPGVRGLASRWSQRLASLLLVFVWLTSAAYADVAAADLVDVKKSHWAYMAIQQVMDKYHIISGFPDKTFRGAKTLSRYELAAALTKTIAAIELAKGVDLKSPAGTPRTFADVPQDHWAAPSVNVVANQYGLVEGFPDGTFRGTRDSTRNEIAAMLAKLGARLEERIGPYTGEMGDDFKKFHDIRDGHWANAAIQAVTDRYAIMQGFPGHYFQGGRKLTRYEFAALLWRLMRFALALTPQAPPTAPPTVAPTPEPTPQPFRVRPLPLMRMVDLQGNFFGGASSSFGSSYTSMYGAFGRATGWLPSDWARWGPGHFGIGGHAAVTFGDAVTWIPAGIVVPPPTGGAALTLASTNLNQTNVMAGLQLKYRLDFSKAWGTTADESDLNPSVTLGVGYGVAYLRNAFMPYLAHGVTASLEGEYPVAAAFGSTTIGFYANADYSYYFTDAQKNYNYLNGRIPTSVAYGAGVEFGGFNWESGDITFRAGYQGYTVFQDVLGNGNRMFQMNGGHAGIRLRI